MRSGLVLIIVGSFKSTYKHQKNKTLHFSKLCILNTIKFDRIGIQIVVTEFDIVTHIVKQNNTK